MGVEVDIATVDALLKKLGPSVASAPGERLHYTCRGLLDCDITALCALAVLQPNGLDGLVSINLAHNIIGDDGAVALGKALASGAPTLRKLALHENRIGDTGAAAIARAMCPDGAPNVQTLRIEFNRIGDKGMIALAASWLEDGGQHLSEVYAAGNEITSDGLTALADALHAAPLLRTLALDSSVGGNRVGDDGARALCRALRKNTAREITIDLKCNALSPAGIGELRLAERECSPGVRILLPAERASALKRAPPQSEPEQLGSGMGSDEAAIRTATEDALSA